MDARSADSSAHDAAIERSPLVRLARQLAPDYEVVSVSEPIPQTHRYNVTALVESTEDARKTVLALERAESKADGDDIGLVVMGSQPVVPDSAVDPEGVAGDVGRRVAVGAAIGALVGAVAGIVVAVIADGIGLLAPALGGAALVAVFGAVWAAFAGFGGSDAYRQTFVEPHARELSLVSFHTDDELRAEDAFERLAADDRSRVEIYDETLTHSVPRPG